MEESDCSRIQPPPLPPPLFPNTDIISISKATEKTGKEEKEEAESGNASFDSSPSIPPFSYENCKRKWIRREILSTERSYIEVLEKIRTIFMEPMCSKGILTRQQSTDLFANLLDLIKVNTELFNQLSARLDEPSLCAQSPQSQPQPLCIDHAFPAISTPNEEASILIPQNEEDHDPALGDIFINLSPFLKIYSVYAKNYANAVRLYSDLRRRNPEFCEFLTEALGRAECNGLSFEAFILAPIQRIPRYKLLLQDLLKNTPAHHHDYFLLSKALHSIEQVALFLNETIRNHEMILEMIRLQKQICGMSEDLIIPGRTLIKKGPLTKVCRKSLKPRMLFLFSDILIYATIGSVGNGSDHGESYNFHRKLSLSQMHIVANVSLGGKRRGAFDAESCESVGERRTPEKSFALICTSIKEKDSWVSELETAIMLYQSNKQTLKLCDGKEQSDVRIPLELYAAPIWIPDSAVSHCMECCAEFSLLKRRHHCRSCGHILCSKCSSKRSILPSQYRVIPNSSTAGTGFASFASELVRVCDPCYSIIEAKLISLKRELQRSSVLEMERPLSSCTSRKLSQIFADGTELESQTPDSSQQVGPEEKDDESVCYSDESEDEINTVCHEQQSLYSKSMHSISRLTIRSRRSSVEFRTDLRMSDKSTLPISAKKPIIVNRDRLSPKSITFSQIHTWTRPAFAIANSLKCSRPSPTLIITPRHSSSLLVSKQSFNFGNSVSTLAPIDVHGDVSSCRPRSKSELIPPLPKDRSLKRRKTIAIFKPVGEFKPHAETKSETIELKKRSLLSVLRDRVVPHEKSFEYLTSVNSLNQEESEKNALLKKKPSSCSMARPRSPPAPCPDSIIVKSGFLVKRGKRFKSWKLRWFVLTSTEILWFKPEEEIRYRNCRSKPTCVNRCNNPNLMNSLKLEHCTGVSFANDQEIDFEYCHKPNPKMFSSFVSSLIPSQPDTSRDISESFDSRKTNEEMARYPFKLITESRVLFMLSFSAAERDDWIVALSEAVSNALVRCSEMKAVEIVHVTQECD